MEFVIAALAVLAGIIGIVGSIMPALPGPPMTWLGMLLLYFWGGTNGTGEPMSLTILLVWLGITVIVSILDWWVPMKFTKFTGGSKYAGRGALIGMIAGIIFTPVGMLLGSFLGALIAEMAYGKKGFERSVHAAIGSFLGFLFGTGMKLIVCICMMFYIFIYML